MLRMLLRVGISRPRCLDIQQMMPEYPAPHAWLSMCHAVVHSEHNTKVKLPRSDRSTAAGHASGGEPAPLACAGAVVAGSAPALPASASAGAGAGGVGTAATGADAAQAARGAPAPPAGESPAGEPALAAVRVRSLSGCTARPFLGTHRQRAGTGSVRAAAGGSGAATRRRARESAGVFPSMKPDVSPAAAAEV